MINNSDVALYLRHMAATKGAANGPLVVNEQTITNALKGSTMKTTQGKVSIPVVGKYVRKLEGGSTSPAIKVSNGVIVDGNYCYVAGRVFGVEPAAIPGAISPSQVPFSKPIQELKFGPLDW